MWAFAIWDRSTETLFLARDRFGIKPLFVLRTMDRLAFASEMKAFLSLPGFHPEVNWPVFKAELLENHSQEGGEACLLRGIQRIRPGHFAVATREEFRTVRWWNTLDHLVEAPLGLEQQALRFRELFEDACRLRMRSDVPIGTSLSGGLDSSSVVCTVARVARQGDTRQAADWQQAFIATFPGSAVDEQAYADTVVAQADVRAVHRAITAEEALAGVERSIYHIEQLEIAPLAQLSLLYERQREHGVIVTLDGHGGDELLAGYPGYVLSALYDAGNLRGSPRRYLDLLRIYRGMLGSPSDTGPREDLAALAWDTSTWLRNTRKLGRRVGLRLGPPPRSCDGGGSESWLSGELAALPAAVPTPATPIDSASLFRRQHYRDFHETVLPEILRNYDRLSMAHGVEVRMPLMDWRLVTYAFSLPSSSLLGYGYSKLILRRAMRGIVPGAVLDRRDKIGFASPVSQWLQGPWRSWLCDTVSSSDFLNNPAWDGDRLRHYVEQRLSQDDWTWKSWSTVWSFLHAQMWLRLFTAGAAGSARP